MQRDKQAGGVAPWFVIKMVVKFVTPHTQCQVSFFSRQWYQTQQLWL